ncbi:MAG: D-alanine--D-alanine ligase family protein [Bacteroidota bacterium]
MAASINKSKQDPKRKIRIGVIFGGRSAEHEVSLVSAASVINALDKNRYEVIPIGITPEGRWLSSPDAVKLLKAGDKLDKLPERILLPDPTHKNLVAIEANKEKGLEKQLDVIFPLVHGTFGEDGTLQGLLELANIPYVGAGVLGSAVGMDKVVAKQLFEQAGIPVAPYVSFLNSKYTSGSTKKIVTQIEKKLGYPCFIKPANSGSSVGISKAHGRKELIQYIDLAMDYDRKILVEKSIENAREIELSVLGNDDPIASIPGEIISSNEFYDYDAKYVDGKSVPDIPAKLPPKVVKRLQEYAVEGYKAIDCSGMARVDFLVKRKTNRIILNEINTIPGFTSISMYPKLWDASGIPFSELLDRLIQLAIDRHKQKSGLKTMYVPKTEWYKG